MAKSFWSLPPDERKLFLQRQKEKAQKRAADPVLVTRRNEQRRSRYSSIPRVRLKNRGRKYGILPEEITRLYNSQNCVCAICEQEKSLDTNLHIDHCHTTGKVRGLLCVKCNIAIGLFEDSTERLRAAAKYIEDHQ
jgi:hypothetical protein